MPCVLWVRPVVGFSLMKLKPPYLQTLSVPCKPKSTKHCPHMHVAGDTQSELRPHHPIIVKHLRQSIKVHDQRPGWRREWKRAG